MRPHRRAPRLLTAALATLVVAATLTALLTTNDSAETPVAAYSEDTVQSLDVDVQGTLANPSSVTITAPYTVGAEPFWTGSETLLTVNAGLDRKTRVTVWKPSGNAVADFEAPVTISGTLDGVFTIVDNNLGATEEHLRAEVSVKDPAYVNVRINTTQGWKSYNLTPHAKAEYDPDGEVVRYEVWNPLYVLDGDVAPHLESLPGNGTVFSAWRTASAHQAGEQDVHVTLLGDDTEIPDANITIDDSGDDPLLDGVTIRDADGNALLHAAVDPPHAGQKRLWINLSGPLVQTLTAATVGHPAAANHTSGWGFQETTYVNLGVPAGTQLPQGDLLVYYRDAKGALLAADVRDPATLTPLASLANSVYGHEAAVWLPTERTTLTANEGGAGFDLAASARHELVDVTLRDADGATAARLQVHEGVPPAIVVTANGETTQVTPNTLLGVVTSLEGEYGYELPGAPATVSEATITNLAGEAVATATETSDGVVAEVSGREVSVPGGVIDVEGNPADAGGFSLVVNDAGGAEALRVDVARRSVLGSSDFGRPHVEVTATDATGEAPFTRVVATPLWLEGDLEANSLTGAGVTNPADPGQTLVSVEEKGGKWHVTTLHEGYVVQANHLGVTGDPAKDDRVDLILRGADGGTVLVATIDRAVTPAVVSLSGAVEHTISGPISLVGSPRNPDRLAVLDPAGEALLTYEKAAGDTVTVSAAGQSHSAPRSLVVIEGNPLGPGDLAIRVRDPATGAVTEHVVDRDAAVRNLLGEAGQDPEPILTVLRDLQSPPGHFRYADDGENRLQPGELDGGAWVSGLRDITFHARLPAADARDRVAVRYALDSAPIPGSPEVEFTTGELVDPTERAYAATIPAAVAGQWTDGRTLAFEVLYETHLNPFVTVAQRDDSNGEPYTVRVDVGAPTAAVSAPETPEETTWTVSWEGSDAASGVAAYYVQKQADGGPWEPWIDGTADTSAQFSGDAGAVYRFRVLAEDAAGNLGAWSAPARVAPGAAGTGGDGVNDPPTVRFTAPRSGDALQGVVAVTWEAADPDGTTPVTNLYVSSDGGRTWESLYAGADSTYYWATEDWDDGGDYRLKLAVTDGSLQNLDLVTGLTVANAGAGPGDGGDGGGGDTQSAGEEGWRRFLPAPAPLLVLAGAGAAAALTRRRR